MSRFFRQSNAGFSGYAGLALFLIAYLAVVVLIVAPKDIFVSKGVIASEAFSR